MSDTAYLLRSYPTESIVQESRFSDGPCYQQVNTLSFLQGADNASLNHSECIHNSDESILTCKLGLYDIASLDDYPLDKINILILFVQELPEKTFKSRVLNLCFINRFSSSLRELAICGYRPPVTKAALRSDLQILDISALAIVASNIETLLISGVNLWQSVELRQFSSLKHLLIIQGDTIEMRYYHSPHCADCIGVHPQASFSFHYLIPLSSQIIYFLYDTSYRYESCTYDLLKKIRAKPGTISTFIVASAAFKSDVDKEICQTCDSGLCPLLAVCLDAKSKERRNEKIPFDCLCVEDLRVEDEFITCDPMTLHQPMYSTRCNHTPSFWNYVSPSIIVATTYISSSIIVFICSTIFILKTKE